MTAIQPRAVDLASYFTQGWYGFDPKTDDVTPIQSASDNLYDSRGMSWVNLNPRSTGTIGPHSPEGP